MLNRKIYRYIYCIFCKEYLTRLGCLPPWFTGDYSKVCNRTLSEEDIQFLSYSIVRHFDMDEYPECMRPCTRLNIRSRIMRLHSINSLPLNEQICSSLSLSPFRELKLKKPGLKIIFDPTVEVAESSRIHTPLSVLSNIGGFLGLCLGYSLLDGGRVLKILSECFNRSSRLNCQDQTPGKIQEAVV